jgi:hypothetical protein
LFIGWWVSGNQPFRAVLVAFDGLGLEIFIDDQ